MGVVAIGSGIRRAEKWFDGTCLRVISMSARYAPHESDRPEFLGK